jgi:prophage tail gpP-like protein
MEDKVVLIIGNSKIPYEGWTSVDINKSLENLSGSFSISMTQLFNTDNVITSFIIKKGDKCVLTINDEPIITGFVDDVNIGYTSTSHTINVTGRDTTKDLIDGSLIGSADLIASYTPKKLVEHILLVKGMTSINVIDNTGLSLKYDEDFNASAGKNAWQQLDKYLQKKSIFATVNENGDIILFRGSFGSTSDALFHLIQGGNIKNNIKSGNRIDSEKDRFNKIVVLSQSPSSVSDGSFSEQGGESYSAIDSSIRDTRQLEIVANANLTSKECQDLANFQKNIRQARGTGYTYTIQGFTQTNGDLWLPNYEVYIQDEYFNIADSFLIKSVNLKQNIGTGTITTLEVVDKLAYTLREPVATTKEAEALDF